jgi:CDGSH-type Zn-finger protein
MADQTKDQSTSEKDSVKIIVSKNGPYIVTGKVPLTISEICSDDEGYCRTWREVKAFPMQEKYALCRCGNSNNRPFCDGTHLKVNFDGTESGDRQPFDEGAEVINGPTLSLADNNHLCVHARFCMRAGGIWDLTKHSDDQESREIAIDEACNCPSGRLVLTDCESGETIEPEFEKSIVVVEYPPRGEHGPLWVRGGIPIESYDGKPYEIRNRVTLCRCGRSRNKPFCDGRHIQR